MFREHGVLVSWFGAWLHVLLFRDSDCPASPVLLEMHVQGCGHDLPNSNVTGFGLSQHMRCGNSGHLVAESHQS